MPVSLCRFASGRDAGDAAWLEGAGGAVETTARVRICGDGFHTLLDVHFSQCSTASVYQLLVFLHIVTKCNAQTLPSKNTLARSVNHCMRVCCTCNPKLV